MTLPRYAGYKNSASRELGMVPIHWTVAPIKTVAQLFGRIGFRGYTTADIVDEGEGALTLSPGNLIHGTISLEKCTYLSWAKYHESPEIQIQLGDVLMVKTGSSLGKVAVMSAADAPPATINPQLIVFKEVTCCRKFLLYSLMSDVIQGSISFSNTGGSIPTMTQECIGNFRICVPPTAEQTAIAAFLDRETGKIDALVAEQEKLIALLKEKRQAVISHAVTKGLDPTAPMKDSGIEWLGEVPAHWACTRIGRYIQVLSGFAFPSAGFSHDEGDARLLRGVNIGVNEIRWDDAVYWKRTGNDGLEGFELSVGDIVLGMDRPWISKGVRIARVSAQDVPCLLLQRVASIKTNNDLDPRFAFRILDSAAFISFLEPDMTGVSVPHISPSQISAFPIPIPPIGEQSAIIAHLDRETAKLDTLTAEAGRAIDLLKERRTALISAAVTGKIDVRGLVNIQEEAA